MKIKNTRFIISRYILLISVLFCLIGPVFSLAAEPHVLPFEPSELRSSITQADIDKIYSGVQPFLMPYATSNVYALNDSATTILMGADSVGVIARYGKGKIAVLGSEEFTMNEYLSAQPQAKKFLTNLKGWLTAGSRQKLVFSNPYMSEQQAIVLQNYIKSGGCALVAYKGWVLDYTPDTSRNQLVANTKSIADYPLQRVLNDMGIAFTSMNEIDIVKAKEPNLKNFKASSLNSLWAKLDCNYDVDQDSYVEVFQCDQSANYFSVYDKVKDILKSINIKSSPGALLNQNLKSTDWLSIKSMKLQHFLLRQLSIHQPLSLKANQAAHKSASLFPGLVTTSSASKLAQIKVSLEPPQKNTLFINTMPLNWISTGQYVPAGKNIVINVPKGVNNLEVQIGAHNDTLDYRSELKRMPTVTGKVLLKPGSNTLSSPFGGLLYLIPIETSEGMAKSTVNTAIVSVSGTVEAPFYQLGLTSEQDWNQMLDKSVAPWCELKGNRMILTLPTLYAKQVKNPEDLMKTYDKIVQLEEQLSGISFTDRVKEPWRIVTDDQLWVGFMYSGYPIMAHTADSALSLIDPHALMHNEWGIWHELGHNYQMPAMTWTAMGEVTNNLFSLYVQEFFGNNSYIYYSDVEDQPAPIIRVKDYLSLPSQDKHYESIDPFDRLVMLNNLKEKYGWSFITALHQEYRKIPLEKQPQQDSDKIDLFIKLCSKLAKEDLTSYFESWGIRPK